MAQRDQIRRIGNQLHDIVGSDAFLDAVVEFAAGERALARLKANPRAHLKGKGLRIPDEMSVEFTGGTPWRLSLSLTAERTVRYGAEVSSGGAGPESDPKDRGRFKRLHKEVRERLVSDTFLDALEEAARDGRALAEYKANPRAQLKKKGINISDELEVKVTEGSLCCHWECCRVWGIKVCWPVCHLDSH